MAATQQQMQNAENVFNTIIKMLDSIKFHYETDTSDGMFMVTCTVNGDDIPMKVFMFVRPEREIVSLLSPIPVKVPEDKRVEMALAVTMANFGMIDGSFDYDLERGEIRFRLTESFVESLLGAEQFRYMLGVSVNTVDRFNDRFLMLAKGMMTLDQFSAALSK